MPFERFVQLLELMHDTSARSALDVQASLYEHLGSGLFLTRAEVADVMDALDPELRAQMREELFERGLTPSE